MNKGFLSKMQGTYKADRGDFSKGSIGKILFRQALPMTVGLIVNALYNVVDRMFVGHIDVVGRDALTGLGLAFPIISIIAAFYNLCVTGSSDFAISRGKGDDEKAAKIQGNIFMLLVFFSALLMVIGYIVKDPVLRLIGAHGDILGYANDYLAIYLIGTPFVLLSLGLNPQINAQGAPKVGMLTIIIGAVANIILDPIFIFAFDMGVRGAAVATVISQFISAAWVLSFLFFNAPVKLRLWCMKPDGKVMLRIMSLGISGFTMQATNSIISMVFNSQLMIFGGDIYVSAMTIVNTLREMTFMPVSGVTHSMRPLLGYNYGAKQYDRVKGTIKLGVKVCLIYNIIVWAIFMAFPAFFVKLFNNDAALLPIAVKSIRIFFCAFFMMTFMMVGQSTFVGLGYAKHAMFFSLFRKVVINVSFALLLPRVTNLGADGVFWAEPISECIGGLACFITMMLTVWPKLKPTEDE